MWWGRLRWVGRGSWIFFMVGGGVEIYFGLVGQADIFKSGEGSVEENFGWVGVSGGIS